jgi:hypothetical protein
VGLESIRPRMLIRVRLQMHEWLIKKDEWLGRQAHLLLPWKGKRIRLHPRIKMGGGGLLMPARLLIMVFLVVSWQKVL